MARLCQREFDVDEDVVEVFFRFIVYRGDVDSLQSPVAIQPHVLPHVYVLILTAFLVQAVFYRDNVRWTPLVCFLILDACFVLSPAGKKSGFQDRSMTYTMHAL